MTRPAVPRRLLAVIALAGAGLLLIATTNTSAAAAHCAPGQEPEFVLGFAFMKSQLGDTMGEPLECEHANPDNGDTLQQTTTGLSFYRKSTNTPTFTDGWRHWGWTAAGMVFWTGDSIDPPETTQAPPDAGEAPTPTPVPTPNQAATNFYGFPCEIESNPRPEFTADVTDLSLVEVIVPAGNQAGAVIKQHSFIVLGGNLPDSPMGPAAPVYAPVDSRFITGSYYAQGGVNEYLLFFEASCEVVYKFDHIRWIVPELRALLPSEPASDSGTTFFANPVEVTAGQLIGYTPGTGDPGQGGPFDFGLFNNTFTGTFANQARYASGGYDQLLHADCPYDYHPEPQRGAYLALFGTPGRVRIGAETCRPISRDVPGTVAGAWFTDRGFEATFAIATTLANEVRIGGPGFTMWVNPGEPTWADPATITTEHCYQQERGGEHQCAYLRLLSPTELAVANGAGACPGALPGGYITVVR